MSYPSLFFPGTLCDERVWLPVWQQLGLPQRRYVPLQWANSLEDMLSLTNDRVLADEKVHLIGFSMGGYVAAKWALANCNKVASLTLIGYAPQGLTKREETKRKAILSSLSTKNFKPRAQGFTKPYVLPQNLTSENVGDVVVSMAEDLGATTLKAHITSTTPRENLLVPLSKTSFPIKLIGSQQDIIAPFSSLLDAQKQLKNAQLTAIDNAAHMMLLENVSDTSKALTFLK